MENSTWSVRELQAKKKQPELQIPAFGTSITKA